MLVYLDIGMDPKMQLPAALRLAPIQCMGWVHPVTSGLPTIDYFLSSELMEPDDADAHYSERLVRLPNLGISYPFPDVPDVARSKTHRAENDKHVVYLCSQSLFKLLPQFDALYARIATQAPISRFWFIANRSAHVTKQFMERLGSAFSDLGISAEKHCVIHPRMDLAGFLGLNAEADILLDSILWSGCNSTFEAIACGLPVVTLPGSMMRGRHSYAILKMMELEETISRNEDHYVEIAVRLGKNDGWRKSIADKVKETRSRVFNDETPIRALEDFFERVCRASTGVLREKALVS